MVVDSLVFRPNAVNSIWMIEEIIVQDMVELGQEHDGCCSVICPLMTLASITP